MVNKSRCDQQEGSYRQGKRNKEEDRIRYISKAIQLHHILSVNQMCRSGDMLECDQELFASLSNYDVGLRNQARLSTIFKTNTMPPKIHQLRLLSLLGAYRGCAQRMQLAVPLVRWSRNRRQLQSGMSK